jgi:hypothetical protein
MVTKGSDHSGPSVTNKILSNDMALQSKETDKIITFNKLYLKKFQI